ncbi:hypothetical protein [Aliiroseovarius sp. YM-037]|uniref:hypothetical protein n=1 Tax=Aliiroseovarius sp. YM-037 TaxID=3341728 RepID=UPI003A80E5E5
MAKGKKKGSPKPTEDGNAVPVDPPGYGEYFDADGSSRNLGECVWAVCRDLENLRDNLTKVDEGLEGRIEYLGEAIEALSTKIKDLDEKKIPKIDGKVEKLWFIPELMGWVKKKKLVTIPLAISAFTAVIASLAIVGFVLFSDKCEGFWPKLNCIMSRTADNAVAHAIINGPENAADFGLVLDSDETFQNKLGDFHSTFVEVGEVFPEIEEALGIGREEYRSLKEARLDPAAAIRYFRDHGETVEDWVKRDILVSLVSEFSKSLVGARSEEYFFLSEHAEMLGETVLQQKLATLAFSVQDQNVRYEAMLRRLEVLSGDAYEVRGQNLLKVAESTDQIRDRAWKRLLVLVAENPDSNSQFVLPSAYRSAIGVTSIYRGKYIRQLDTALAELINHSSGRGQNVNVYLARAWTTLLMSGENSIERALDHYRSANELRADQGGSIWVIATGRWREEFVQHVSGIIASASKTDQIDWPKDDEVIVKADLELPPSKPALD